jgi:NAD+ kinase
VEERLMLQADLRRNGSYIHQFTALNDLVVGRGKQARVLHLHLSVDGDHVTTYTADALIVATPTGSTGYSLSCNGPVVFPDSGSFVITPVAPHNLNLRSIVVPDDVVITFEVEGRSDTFLCTLDSRSETINSHTQLAIRKENFNISLVRPHEHNFLKTIRQKLYWGIDKRN